MGKKWLDLLVMQTYDWQKQWHCSRNEKLNELHTGHIKNVKFICTCALKDHYCVALLEDAESEYGEVIYHTNIRWLS